MVVETGTAVSALTVIGSNDDYTGTTSQVSFNASAGTTYAFRVDGYSTGNIALALTTQPLPTVSVAATAPQAAEAGQVPGVFTFTLSQAVSTPLTINFAWLGTATLGTDYVVTGAASGPAVTIPAGQTSTTVTITPVDDNDPPRPLPPRFSSWTTRLTLRPGRAPISLWDSLARWPRHWLIPMVTASLTCWSLPST